MRQLKHHEKKLLRKVDFVQWKHDDNIREIKILRRYLIQDREDYVECVDSGGGGGMDEGGGGRAQRGGRAARCEVRSALCAGTISCVAWRLV